MSLLDALIVLSSRRELSKSSKWIDKAWTEAVSNQICLNRDLQTCSSKFLRTLSNWNPRWTWHPQSIANYRSCVRPTYQSHQHRWMSWTCLTEPTVITRCVEICTQMWLRKHSTFVTCITITSNSYIAWWRSSDSFTQHRLHPNLWHLKRNS